MELELKYNPDNSEINVLQDIISCLNQLSECYNSKIKDLEREKKGLEIEKVAIIKALKDDNIENLKQYFGINA